MDSASCRIAADPILLSIVTFLRGLPIDCMAIIGRYLERMRFGKALRQICK